MASVRRVSGPSARGSSSSSATVTMSAAWTIRLARSVKGASPRFPARSAVGGRPSSVELGRFGRDGAALTQDDLLDLQTCGFQLLLAVGLQGRAALVDVDRALQRGLARLQLGHDP